MRDAAERKENGLETENKITDLSGYISRIAKETEDIDKDRVIVFRGENRIYDQPCYPNLFRRKILDINPGFEKNQFDEMTANHLTNGSTYLEKAIDAQHGGFPSRLLDVTYNCLVALYFAVTPFYTKEEDSEDGPGNDGMVYIFPMEKMYCPAGNNIVNAYDAIVERKEKWISDERIFGKNHKLIDHIKLNPRIMAQQGAFLLFQGDEGEPVPEYMYRKIRISGEYKKKLREELRRLHGIHTGSVYPENFNLVDEIYRKTMNVNASEFGIRSELELILANLRKALAYYEDELEKVLDGSGEESFIRSLVEAEKVIRDYREGLGTLDTPEAEEKYRTVDGYAGAVKQAKADFNACITAFYDELEDFSPDDIKFSKQYLLFT